MKRNWARQNQFFHVSEPNLSLAEKHRRFQKAYNVRRRLPANLNRPRESIGRLDVAKIVYDPVDQALSELGFERSSNKIWARRDLAPICHIFSLERYGSTGWKISPAFGLSLDFVPHIENGAVKWHRTVKSARYDLRVETNSRWFGVATFGHKTSLQEDTEFMLPRALKMAHRFWNDATDFEQVAERFEWHKGWLSRRYNYKFADGEYVEPTPARAFLAAKLGDPTLAKELLDKWLDRERKIQKYDLDPEVPMKLHRLLAETVPD